MTSTNQKNFSIDSTRHKRVLDILDKWHQRDENISHNICIAIERLDAELERGSKIDQYTSQDELIRLPRMNQLLKEEDIVYLYKSMNWKDLHSLSSIMAANSSKMMEAVFSPRHSKL